MIAPPLVLASASPRREELLRSAGIELTTFPTGTTESADESLGLAGLVMANARMKAMDAAASNATSVVLGADTVVWLDGRALGKPANLAEARRMLEALSGRTHEVATGVHIVRLEPLLRVEFHETTRVRFRAFDGATVEEYLAEVDVLDKAGAYALQEHGEMLVESVEGSRSNVIGLPLERTLEALRHFTRQLGCET